MADSTPPRGPSVLAGLQPSPADVTLTAPSPSGVTVALPVLSLDFEGARGRKCCAVIGPHDSHEDVRGKILDSYFGSSDRADVVLQKLTFVGNGTQLSLSNFSSQVCTGAEPCGFYQLRTTCTNCVPHVLKPTSPRFATVPSRASPGPLLLGDTTCDLWVEPRP